MRLEMLRKSAEYQHFVEETYLEHDIPEENRWEPSVLVPSPRMERDATLHQVNLLSGTAGIHVVLTGFEPHICNQAKKLKPALLENLLLEEELAKQKKSAKNILKKEIDSGRLVSQETVLLTRNFFEGEMKKMRSEALERAEQMRSEALERAEQMRSEALERAEQMRSEALEREKQMRLEMRKEIKEEIKKNNFAFQARLSFFNLIGRTREKIVENAKMRVNKDYQNWTDLLTDSNAQHQIDRSILDLGIPADLWTSCRREARMFNEDKHGPLSLEGLRREEEHLRGSEEFSELCANFSQLIDLFAERGWVT
jgi:organic radical activating enzyme